MSPHIVDGADAPPDPEAVEQAPWLGEAFALLWSREDIGPLNGRGALRLLDTVDRRVPLGLPWCGIFVAHCLCATYPEIELPRLYPRARPWLGWGREVAPRVGAVLVFWRLHPLTPLGHVGFCVSEDADTFDVIGGNQHDRIAVERRSKSQFLGARWPAGVPVPEVRRSPGQARSA